MNLLTMLGLVTTLLVSAVFPIKGGGNALRSTRPTTSQLNYEVQPNLKPNASQLQLKASSAAIYDVSSGTYLQKKEIDSQRPIASINKLMTALVIMDAHKPNEVVKVGELPILGPYDQKIGIKAGEEFELSELLKATLIQSDNDAANALAIYDSGSIESFALKMNQKAREWGLDNSKYSNANGLEGGDDYSSVKDVLTLANLLYQNATFQRIVATKTDTISDLAGKSFGISTTNKILGQSGVIGMKTGYTLKAGECLVTVASRDGNTIMTVVLDSPDRFQESKNMIDWAFNNYIWQ